MTGVFISYRRIDTVAWAGRLFADLARSFGPGRVFMDINGGIPRGADFEQVLDGALAGCDALLALIGPQWLTCTRDGRRRIDAPDDWVRREVATALGRGIPVVPVCFGSAPMPSAADRLPDDLSALLRRQAAVISDERWDYDLGELVKDLLRAVPGLAADDVAHARRGLDLLKDLIDRFPPIAEAVARSREAIAATSRQVERLDRFKTLHDALHAIEFECLRPMQAAGASPRLRPFKIAFANEARRMQDCLRDQDINPALRDEILDGLSLAGEAFQRALDGPGADSQAALLAELETLLSGLPPRLDAGIADAAAELRLDRLVELMGRVRARLEPAQGHDDVELARFVDGIDALGRLRTALEAQVAEHVQLQRLDSKLRAVCLGGSAALPAEWNRIRLLRSRLPAQPSLPLEAALPDLGAIEAEIDGLVARPEGQREAADLLREYFRAVASVFRDVDSALKDFCLRLTEVNRPLALVLELSQPVNAGRMP